jgi:hypothetical protein
MAEFIDRADGLEVHDVPDGYIVYQTARDKVHYLNKTAAIIFEFCDGQRDRSEIVSRVATAFELAPTMQGEVSNCLDSLIGEGLVLCRQR